jgi:hypothetical protein
VLTDVPLTAPVYAYAYAIFGLMTPVVRFSSLDEAVQLAKGTAAESGNGSRAGGPQANLDAYTDAQWVTSRGELPSYLF